MTLDPTDPTSAVAINLIAGEEPPEGKRFSTDTGLKTGVFPANERLRYISTQDDELLDIIDPRKFRSAKQLDQHLRWLNPNETAPMAPGWE